jgi:AcrR family transcriptional regulator
VSNPSVRGPRPYRLNKRAEQMDDTRLRIVESAVALHGSVGPARTSVVAIAQLAGVTRATVYRHFRDESALFEACSAHWQNQQVAPDPSSWALVTDPIERIQIGLSDLYRFYRAGESMLTRIRRDILSVPDNIRRRIDATDEQFRDVLLVGFPPRKDRHVLRAAVAHAISFWTWRSLCVDHGLKDTEAVALMIDVAVSAATRKP